MITQIALGESIQRAIDSVPDDSIIQIEAGNYEQYIRLDWRNSLRFEAIDGIVHIQPKRKEDAFLLVNCYDIDFDKGFKFSDVYGGSIVKDVPNPIGNPATAHSAGLHFEYCKKIMLDSPTTNDCNIGIMFARCNNVNVYNSTTTNSGEAGIRFKQSDYVVCRNADSYGNGFPTNRLYSEGAGGHGIIFYKGLYGEITDCKLHNNFDCPFYIYEGTNPYDKDWKLLPTHFLRFEHNYLKHEGDGKAHEAGAPLYLSVYERNEHSNVFANNVFENSTNNDGIYMISGPWFDVKRKIQIDRRTYFWDEMIETLAELNPNSIGNVKV